MRLRLRTGIASVGLVALAATLPGQASVAALARSTATAQVRVNQLGYPSGLPKRAYLMAPTAATGATFSVQGDGRTVYSATVGPDQGAWSAAFPHVYLLDFNSVREPGTYVITVSTPGVAQSLAFRIGSPASLYASAVANGLSYFQNERDGANFIPSGLRTAPGHLNDRHAMTYLTPITNSSGGFDGDLKPLGGLIDASGAWWDAGDYLKFVETTTYSVAMLLAGIRDFSGQMGRGSNSDYTAEAAFGLEWLSRMWQDGSRTLYYQAGIGSGNNNTVADHDIWRLPQVDDTYGGSDPLYRYIRNRPVFRAASAGSLISPNLAGRLAADFGLCSQVFADTRPALAARCLLSGEHVFDLANTAPTGNLLTVIPFDFYPETEWRDDLELGATELYLALRKDEERHAGAAARTLPHANPDFYLRLASHWARAYITGPNDAKDTLNLYDVSGFAHFDLYRGIKSAGDPAGLEVSLGQLLSDLAKQLTTAETFAAADPFGFGFPWAAFDTTSHGAGIAVTAAEYDALTGSQRYRADAARWLGNILGANAWGTSLIVGDGKVFPNCMQHQVTNLVGSLDGSPPILAGAAVEGPNTFAATGVVPGMRTCPANGIDSFAAFNGSGSVFQDNVQSYSTVEPALDLAATSPLAFAWQIAATP